MTFPAYWAVYSLFHPNDPTSKAVCTLGNKSCGQPGKSNFSLISRDIFVTQRRQI